MHFPFATRIFLNSVATTPRVDGGSKLRVPLATELPLSTPYQISAVTCPESLLQVMIARFLGRGNFGSPAPAGNFAERSASGVGQMS